MHNVSSFELSLPSIIGFILISIAVGYLFVGKVVPYIRIHRERKQVEEKVTVLAKQKHVGMVNDFLTDVEYYLKNLYQEYGYLDSTAIGHVIKHIREMGEVHFPLRFKAMWIGNTTGYEITVIVDEDIFVLMGDWMIDDNDPLAKTLVFIPVLNSN